MCANPSHRLSGSSSAGDADFCCALPLHRSAWISAHTAQLVRTEGAGELIDELIKVATRECRPVYLTLPTDLIHAKISGAALAEPLPLPHSLAPSPVANPSPSPQTKHVLKTILDLYDAAVDPVVLVDAGTSRFGMEQLARQLVETTNMQFFETPMGKAVLDETHPNYGGCYSRSCPLRFSAMLGD
jgi:pyruvate decarboxylase